MSIGNNVLDLLKKEITDVEYNRYIKQLSFAPKLSNENDVYFIAPNPLIMSWIKNRYSENIAHLFEIKTGIKPSVNIILQDISSKKTKQKTKKDASDSKIKQSLLNIAHTFENFVEGGSNKFAYVAAKSVSEQPGKVYNPLFIYGGVGLGKTHLMQAIGNVLQNKGQNIIYVSVEQFFNDFTRHLRNKSMERFKDKYRKCDLLLIDDVQFLSNKNSLQEEFFHTFEELKNDGKQIVITADKHPKKIAGLEERLKSRFEHGLVADIQPPELETKINIIKKKCEINKVKLDNDVITYIATIIENNVREIEGILSKLHAYSQLIHVNITIDFAKNVLKEQLEDKRDHITLDLILKLVAKELNIKPSEITSKSRSRNIVSARRVAIYLAREYTPNTTPQLAKYFGMKDHTAISHTMRKIQELIKNDEGFRLQIEEFKNKITTTS
ncbi:MAG: chromosomal replication initiator protein DnaA [Campylobacterota bacterium]|nr:chromosomal replication initiator protein DnaA [Campylobacterota bacterium]